MSIFPFEKGEWYSVGQLREVAEAIFGKRRADPDFSAALRESNQKRLWWAKAWNEEVFPCRILADRLGLPDDATFSWTPKGAADVEFRSGGRATKIQCTTAHPHWLGALGVQGGHLHHLEMKEANKQGFVWLGGGVSKPTVQDLRTDLETWLVAIADALANKIKADYSGCWLLIYALGCDNIMVDFHFHEAVVPATDRVGRAKWEAVFEGLYILGDQPPNFAEIPNSRTGSSA